MVRVQQERWGKRNVITARNEQGRFITWKPATAISLDAAREQFKTTHTFSKDLKRIESRNFIEYTATTKAEYMVERQGQYARVQLGRIPVVSMKKKSFITQYVVRLRLKSGGEIVARSNQFTPTPENITSARQEAWRNVIARLAQSQGLEYTEEAGSDVLEDEVMSVEEGRVYYIKKKNPVPVY